jgi:hypothetical protein
VKNITINTVDIPSNDPTTGPATQVELRGVADVDDAVGFAAESAVAVAVDFANTEEADASEADSIDC